MNVGGARRADRLISWRQPQMRKCISRDPKLVPLSYPCQKIYRQDFRGEPLAKQSSCLEFEADDGAEENADTLLPDIARMGILPTVEKHVFIVSGCEHRPPCVWRKGGLLPRRRRMSRRVQSPGCLFLRAQREKQKALWGLAIHYGRYGSHTTLCVGGSCGTD
ncbi:uncharacterized protein EI97DRAFT_271612 [Westerdykella ornata]|uniref:Uncharacterized protein n=1 Tax=Westerdykella ornata TaxID=318751 RepID=A0A6A6JRY4_WESOR|nr:uncharacterized protein EI97DRAFT_271612 [Westerdykella ornata]KAF2277719.1 hypothetical protein EI97DRAFT_271612 [Westerdykella ornata]